MGQAGERTIPRLVKANHAQEQTRQQLGYPLNRFPERGGEAKETEEERAERYNDHLQLGAARDVTAGDLTTDRDYAYARHFGFGTCGENAVVTFYNLCKAFPDGTGRGRDSCNVYGLAYQELDHAFNAVSFSDGDKIAIDAWGDGHSVLTRHYQTFRGTKDATNVCFKTHGDNAEYAEVVDEFSFEGDRYLLKSIQKEYDVQSNKYDAWKKEYDVREKNYDVWKKEYDAQEREFNDDEKEYYAQEKKYLESSYQENYIPVYEGPFPNLSDDLLEKDLNTRKNDVRDKLIKEDVDLESFDTEQVRVKYDVMRDIRAVSIEK